MVGYVTSTACSDYISYATYSDCTSTSATYVGNYYAYPSEWVTYITPSYEPELETEEQRQAREEEREAAVKIAEELLKQHIGLDKFGELYSVGHIEVDSHKYKGRKYRVPSDEKMIEILDENGKVIDRLCIHTAIDCPMPDKVLTRLVMLEYAEELLLAQANHHGVPNVS